MSDKKDEKKKAEKGLKFKVGGTLANGEHFKTGDKVPADVDAKELKVLRELDAIED